VAASPVARKSRAPAPDIAAPSNSAAINEVRKKSLADIV
jgi:hypothetical protein